MESLHNIIYGLYNIITFILYFVLAFAEAWSRGALK